LTTAAATNPTKTTTKKNSLFECQRLSTKGWVPKVIPKVAIMYHDRTSLWILPSFFGFLVVNGVIVPIVAIVPMVAIVLYFIPTHYHT
jgi:hypothetical protein